MCCIFVGVESCPSPASCVLSIRVLCILRDVLVGNGKGLPLSRGCGLLASIVLFGFDSLTLLITLNVFRCPMDGGLNPYLDEHAPRPRPYCCFLIGTTNIFFFSSYSFSAQEHGGGEESSKPRDARPVAGAHELRLGGRTRRIHPLGKARSMAGTAINRLIAVFCVCVLFGAACV